MSVHCACVFPSSLRTMGEPHSLSKSCLTVGWFFQRRSVLFGWKKFFPRNIFWLVKMCVCVCFFPPERFFGWSTWRSYNYSYGQRKYHDKLLVITYVIKYVSSKTIIVWYIISYCQLNSNTIRFLEVWFFAGSPNKVVTFVHAFDTDGHHRWGRFEQVRCEITTECFVSYLSRWQVLQRTTQAYGCNKTDGRRRDSG